MGSNPTVPAISKREGKEVFKKVQKFFESRRKPTAWNRITLCDTCKQDPIEHPDGWLTISACPYCGSNEFVRGKLHRKVPVGIRGWAIEYMKR